MTLDQLDAFCSGARQIDRVEKRVELKAPPSRVWRALTDHREFGKWFRVAIDGPFEPGQISRGRITYPGYEHVKWEVVVKQLQSERRFSFTWHPYPIDPKADYSNETSTLVEFTLKKTKKGTLLTVTESGFDQLPAARRPEAFRANAAGWTEQMKNIERHLLSRQKRQR
ncbi:MAG TPA: SRPBCC family protein [Planctomycetota bacterium]